GSGHGGHQLQRVLALGVGGELRHAAVGVGEAPVPAGADQASGVLHRGRRAGRTLEDGPGVLDADVVAVGEERRPERLTPVQGDAPPGADREGRVGVEAGVGVGGVDHHAVPRVAGISHPVAVVVVLVAVGDGGAVVLRIGDAVVVDVLVARITDAVVVGVLLIGIGDGGAVVVRVIDAVPIGVHGADHTRDGQRIGRVGVTGAVVLSIGDAVVVVVGVAGITEAVMVGVELVGVGNGGAVVLGVGDAVAVDVVIAGTPLAVAVGVPLVGVGNGGAVVAGIAHAVTVAVGLVAVGDEGAVVVAVGLSVAVGIVGVGEGLAVVGVAHPHRAAAAAATAAAALLLWSSTLRAQTFRVVAVLGEDRDSPRQSG